jgi:hypothetical protein
MIRVPEHRIAVGSWEDHEQAITQTNPEFQVVVSVCDKTPLFSKTQCRLYWYPVNERASWGYSLFFWSKRVLDFHAAQGHSILIHCTAGVHRSPMILFTWLLSLQVKSHSVDLEAINAMMGGEQDYADLYLWDVRRAKIPSDLERLYELMLDPGKGLQDCLEHMGRHREA